MANTLAPSNSLSIIRGTSRTIEVTFLDADTNSAVDLTGARIILTVKDDIRDDLPTIQKDSLAGITQVEITNAIAGLARIYISYLDTQSLDLGTYVFDIWVILSSGKRYAAVEPSTLEIEPGVTVVS